jgi:hypothetical protein
MTRKISSGEARSTYGNHTMARADASRENIAASQRDEHAVDELGAGNQRVFRRKSASQELSCPRREIHRQVVRRIAWGPPADRGVDLVAFEDVDVPTPAHSAHGRRQAGGPGADYNEPEAVHAFRVIVFSV